MVKEKILTRPPVIFEYGGRTLEIPAEAADTVPTYIVLSSKNVLTVLDWSESEPPQPNLTTAFEFTPVNSELTATELADIFDGVIAKEITRP